MKRKYKRITKFSAIMFLIFGCYSQNQKSNETNQDFYTENISHGSAIVSCKIVELSTEEDTKYAMIKIDTVYGYGVSTPLISEGTELQLLVSTSHSKKMEVSIQSKDDKKIMEVSKPNTGMAMNKSEIWNLKRIIK